MYQLRLLPRARRELDKLPAEVLHRITEALQKLRDDPRPHGVKKLRGSIYRVREGDWRIIYAVSDKENLVLVGRIARRSKDTYDGIEDLF
ncbi:MAG: type II toxin-antitoxin system RelE/ParE family toxin [Chloroflexi bacterium]|nr:type II toxin-antitoxin system RelE/ParE family toxin [Chloroflexota bacterium]